MKLRTDIMCAAAVALAALASCSSTEDLASRFPYLSQIENTECLNSRAIDDDTNGGRTTFAMRISGTFAECCFKGLAYPCDFRNVNVEVSYHDGIMTIIEYPSSDMADCLCEVDASFVIEDFPADRFILKIYRGNTKGHYDKVNPILTQVVDPKKGYLKFPYGY